MIEEYNLYVKERRRKVKPYTVFCLWLALAILVASGIFYMIMRYNDNKENETYLVYNGVKNTLHNNYTERQISAEIKGVKELQEEIDRLYYLKYNYHEDSKKASTTAILCFFASLLCLSIGLMIYFLATPYDKWVEAEERTLQEKLRIQELRNKVQKTTNESDIIPIEHEGELIRARKKKEKEIFEEIVKIEEYILLVKQLKAKQGNDWAYYEKALMDLELRAKAIEIDIKSIPLEEYKMKMLEYETIVKPRIQKTLEGLRGKLK